MANTMNINVFVFTVPKPLGGFLWAQVVNNEYLI